MVGSFKMSKMQRMNRPSAPCSEDPGLSLTSCLESFLIQRVGCNISLLEDRGQGCFNRKRLNYYYSLLIWSVFRSEYFFVFLQCWCRGFVCGENLSV